eukprot:scaffold170201_cov22-Tisochrysis_lutea.AAC.3
MHATSSSRHPRMRTRPAGWPREYVPPAHGPGNSSRTLPIPMVVPSSRSVKRPICAHCSKGSMQTACSISMMHVTTSPDLTNMGLRLERFPERQVAAAAGRRGAAEEGTSGGRRQTDSARGHGCTRAYRSSCRWTSRQKRWTCARAAQPRAPAPQSASPRGTLRRHAMSVRIPAGCPRRRCPALRWARVRFGCRACPRVWRRLFGSRARLELDACVFAANKVGNLVLVEPHVDNLDGHAVGHDVELVAGRDGALLHLRSRGGEGGAGGSPKGWGRLPDGLPTGRRGRPDRDHLALNDGAQVLVLGEDWEAQRAVVITITSRQQV